MRYKNLNSLYLTMLIMATSCGEKTAAVANGNGNQSGASGLVSPEKITPIPQIPTVNVNEFKCKAAALKIPRRYLLSKSEDLNSEENSVLQEEVDFFTKKELGEFKFTVEGDFDKISEAKVTLNGKELEVKISDDGKEFSAVIDKTGRVEARVTRAIKGAEQRIVKMTPKVFVASAVDTVKIIEEVAKLNGIKILDYEVPEDYVLLYFIVYLKLYREINFQIIFQKNGGNDDKLKYMLTKYFSSIKENDDILLDLYSICQISKIEKKVLGDFVEILLLFSTTFDYFENGDFQKLLNYLDFTFENFFEKNEQIGYIYFETALKLFRLDFWDRKINNIEKTMECLNKIGLNAPIEFNLPDIFDENYNLRNIPSLKEFLNVYRLYKIKYFVVNLGKYIYELDENNEKLFEKNPGNIVEFVKFAMQRMAIDYRKEYVEGESWLKIFQQYPRYKPGKIDSLSSGLMSSETILIIKKAAIPYLKIVIKFLEKGILEFDLNVLQFINLLFTKNLVTGNKELKDLINELFGNEKNLAQIEKLKENEEFKKILESNKELKDLIKAKLGI